MPKDLLDSFDPLDNFSPEAITSPLDSFDPLDGFNPTQSTDDPLDSFDPTVQTPTFDEGMNIFGRREQPAIPEPAIVPPVEAAPIGQPSAMVSRAAASLVPKSTPESQAYADKAQRQADAENDRPGIVAQAKRDVVRNLRALAELNIAGTALVSDVVELGLGKVGVDLEVAGKTVAPEAESGDQKASDALLEDYLKSLEASKAYAPVIGSYKNIENVGDAGRYAIEAVANIGVMMLPSLITGGVGAALARKGAEGVVAEMIGKTMTEKAISREAAEKLVAGQVARTVQKKIALGAAAGAAPSSLGIEAASIYGDTYETTGEKAPGISLAFGSAAGVLDVLPSVVAINRIFGKEVGKKAIESAIKRYGVAVVEQALVEAPTEVIQTLLEEAGRAQTSGEKVLTKDTTVKLVDAGLQALIGGSATGIATQGAGDALNKVRSMKAEAAALEADKKVKDAYWKNISDQIRSSVREYRVKETGAPLQTKQDILDTFNPEDLSFSEEALQASLESLKPKTGKEIYRELVKEIPQTEGTDNAPPPAAPPAVNEAGPTTPEGITETRIPKRSELSIEEFRALPPDMQKLVHEQNDVTGKPGQGAFNQILKKRTENFTKPTYVAMGDINGFKVYNDQLLGSARTDVLNAQIFDIYAKHLGQDLNANMHGDEHVAFGDDPATLRDRLAAAAKDVADNLAITLDDGTIYRPTMKWKIGIATTKEDAGKINPKDLDNDTIGFDKSLEKDYVNTRGANVSENEQVTRKLLKEKEDENRIPNTRVGAGAQGEPLKEGKRAGPGAGLGEAPAEQVPLVSGSEPGQTAGELAAALAKEKENLPPAPPAAAPPIKAPTKPKVAPPAAPAFSEAEVPEPLIRKRKQLISTSEGAAKASDEELFQADKLSDQYLSQHPRDPKAKEASLKIAQEIHDRGYDRKKGQFVRVEKPGVRSLARQLEEESKKKTPIAGKEAETIIPKDNEGWYDLVSHLDSAELIRRGLLDHMPERYHKNIKFKLSNNMGHQTFEDRKVAKETAFINDFFDVKSDEHYDPVSKRIVPNDTTKKGRMPFDVWQQENPEITDKMLDDNIGNAVEGLEETRGEKPKAPKQDFLEKARKQVAAEEEYNKYVEAQQKKNEDILPFSRWEQRNLLTNVSNKGKLEEGGQNASKEPTGPEPIRKGVGGEIPSTQRVSAPSDNVGMAEKQRGQVLVDERALGDFEDAMQKELGGRSVRGQVDIVESFGENKDPIDALQKIFPQWGIRTVRLSSDLHRHIPFDGVVVKGQIYLNETTRDPVFWVLAHEANHMMEARHPGLYLKAINDFIDSLTESGMMAVKKRAIAESQGKRSVNMTDSETEKAYEGLTTIQKMVGAKEVFADTFADSFLDNKFLKSLHSTSPVFFKKLIQTFIEAYSKFIKAIKNRFPGFTKKEWFKNIVSTRNSMAILMQDVIAMEHKQATDIEYNSLIDNFLGSLKRDFKKWGIPWSRKGQIDLFDQAPQEEMALPEKEAPAKPLEQTTEKPKSKFEEIYGHQLAVEKREERLLNTTREQAKELSRDDAYQLIAPWMNRDEVLNTQLRSKEGIAALHKEWLGLFRETPERIPIDVLKSYATEKPSRNAKDWFAKEIFNREGDTSKLLEQQALFSRGDLADRNGDKFEKPPSEWGVSMANVKAALERFYNANRDIYEGGYKEYIGRDNSVLAMELENDGEMYQRYFKHLPEDVRVVDVLDAYNKNLLPETLTAPRKGKIVEIGEVPVRKKGRVGEPGKINIIGDKTLKNIYILATQRSTKTTSGKIAGARRVIFWQNTVRKDMPEVFGISKSEFNKKLRVWGGITSEGVALSERINSGVPNVSLWTGIENSAYLASSEVTPKNIDGQVKKIYAIDRSFYGPTGEGLRNYIARVLLGTDTRIDFKDLSFEVSSSISALGQYFPTQKLIKIRDNNPHTVAHEIGHYLAHKWADELYGKSSSTDATEILDSLNVSMFQSKPLLLDWVGNFHDFVMDISERSGISSEYYQRRSEVFARFFSHFIDWVNEKAGKRTWGGDQHYSLDKFNDGDFRRFVKLLQEKAYVDAVGGKKPGAETGKETPLFSRQEAPPYEYKRPAYPFSNEELLDISNEEYEETIRKWMDDMRAYTENLPDIAVFEVPPLNENDQTRRALLSKEPGPDKARYPWRMTRFYVDNQNQTIPTGHDLYTSKNDAVMDLPKYMEYAPDVRFSRQEAPETPLVAKHEKSEFGPVDTNSAEFKAWFGDSKVVDPEGKPLRVYHGTIAEFTKFDTEKIKSRFPYSFGFQFTDRPEEAKAYADKNGLGFGKTDYEDGRIIPVYLSVKNPLVIDTKQAAPSMEADLNRYEIISKIVASRKTDNPYDGVIIRRFFGDEWDGVNVIVFEPTQIKSAMTNTGTFSPENPDIRFSRQESPLDKKISEVMEKKGAEKKSDDSRIDVPQSVNREAQARMRKAKGIKSLPFYAKFKPAIIRMTHAFTRHYGALGPEDAQVADILRQFEAVPEYADAITINALHQITEGLGQNGYDVFSRAIILPDLLKDIDRGLYEGKNRLPFGYKNRAEIRADLDAVEAAAKKYPEIGRALKRRQEFNAALKDDLVKYGLLKKETLEDEAYFHHQVLEKLAEREFISKGTSSKDVRAHKAGFMRGRTGSVLDYNTEYVEAEGEVIAQAISRIETLRTLETLRPLIDISEKLKAQADKEGKPVEALIPEGYTEWSPKENTPFYPAKTIPEAMIEKLLDGSLEEGVTEDQIKTVLALGRKPQWIVKEGVAETLDNIKRPPLPGIAGALDSALKFVNQKWKQWTLLNPFRIIKYNMNNVSGDLDIALAYHPSIMKGFFPAARDMWNHFVRKQPPTEEIRNLIKKGVIGSGFATQEVQDISSSDYFKAMTGKRTGPLAGFWNVGKNVTEWRESILRVAAYRWIKNQLLAGKAAYGASKVSEINAIPDIDDKAAKMARELLGDYGAISEAGQILRSRVMPFISWMEINTPRYIRLLKNSRLEGNVAGKVGRVSAVIAVKTVSKTAKYAITASILFAMVNLWNKLFFPDEEDELGNANRQMHLILGRDKEGNIRTLRIQGALSDALNWLALEDLPNDIWDIVNKKSTIKEKAAEAGISALSKIYNGIGPQYKTPMEMAGKTKRYPTINQPRPIRDVYEYLAATLSVDKPYRLIAGKPSKGILSEAEGNIIYKVNPEENAYYDIKEKARKFLEKNSDYEAPSIIPTEKSNALYFFKKALQYKDMKTARKYWEKYKAMGGNYGAMADGLDMMDPLAAFRGKNAELGDAFEASLSEKDKAILAKAQAWFENFRDISGIAGEWEE